MSIARKVNGTWQSVAGVPTIDEELSATSINPVQNKVVHTALQGKANASDLGTAAAKDSGISNGVAELNSNGKVPSSQLPIFVGTAAQWNALTSEQQNIYDERHITDDNISIEPRGIDSTPTENSTNLITSGAIYSETQSIKAFIGKKLTAQTLAVGSTTLTFTDASITTDSTIEEYYSIRGVTATDVAVTTGQVVMTFDPLDTALSVYLIIK